MNNTFRFLICCPTYLDERLGAAKVYIGLKRILEAQGHCVELVNPDFFNSKPLTYQFFERFKAYICKNQDLYDVVHYEHNAFPYHRSDLPGKLLFVARSVLFSPFCFDIGMHGNPLLDSISYFKNLRLNTKKFINVRKTLLNADLICLCNSREAAFAKTYFKIPSNKILINQFGIEENMIYSFNYENRDTVVFLGTLDPRKGLFDLPFILKFIQKRFQDIRFLLLGTGFYIKDASEQMRRLKMDINSNISIVQQFDKKFISQYLEKCLVGVFPSKVEGYPFGVIEQMVHGIPVFAYEAPGVSEIVPNECLSPINDKLNLAQNIVSCLSKPNYLQYLSLKSFSIASGCNWSINVANFVARISVEINSIKSPKI